MCCTEYTYDIWNADEKSVDHDQKIGVLDTNNMITRMARVSPR